MAEKKKTTRKTKKAAAKKPAKKKAAAKKSPKKKKTAIKTVASKKKTTVKAASKKSEKAKPAKKAASAKPKKAPAKRLSRKRGGACLGEGCKNKSVSDGYCRACYIRYWYQIVEERKLAAREKLNKYVEDMSEKFPKQFMDKIKGDLDNDESFKKRLNEFGFREEFETDKENNPFSREAFHEFVETLKHDL